MLSKFYRNYRNSIEILSKFYRNSIEILLKFYQNSACGDKLDHETISWGMLWACWRPWSVRALPKCKSKGKTRRFLSVPRVATHNDNLRGSTKDPPGSTLLGSNAPRSFSIKEYSLEPEQPSTTRGHGTRDEGR